MRRARMSRRISRNKGNLDGPFTEREGQAEAGSLVPGHAGSRMADYRSRDVIW